MQEDPGAAGVCNQGRGKRHSGRKLGKRLKGGEAEIKGAVDER